MSAFRFNKLVVIQSLENEKPTGRLLVDQIEIWCAKSNRDIPFSYNEFSKASDVLKFLQELIIECSSKDIIPILHIECHGNKKGLVLSSGDLIKWDLLSQQVRQLNLATNSNLLIVLAACHGGYFAQCIDIFDRAPFWGLIGVINTIDASHLLNSLTNFYQALFESAELVELFNALNYSSKYENLQLYTAEWIFSKLYLYLINNKEYLTQNKNTLRKIEFLNNREIFEMTIKHFFLLDIHPQNTDKISVSYNKIVRNLL
ncbi:hypothetical protein [Thalassotalea ganghwensis]